MEQWLGAGACGHSVASYSAGVAKRIILSARRPPAQRAELCLHYLGLFIRLQLARIPDGTGSAAIARKVGAGGTAEFDQSLPLAHFRFCRIDYLAKLSALTRWIPLAMMMRFVAAIISCVFISSSAWSQSSVTITFTAEDLNAMGLSAPSPTMLKMLMIGSYMTVKLGQAQSSLPVAASSGTPTSAVKQQLGSSSVNSTEPVTSVPKEPDLSRQSAATTPASGPITEAQLAKKIESLPKPTKPAEVVRRKDGFEVNGQHFSDPEGKIGLYGYDSVTGNALYLAQTANRGEYLVKATRLGAGAEAILIARATDTGNGWTVVTETGKRLSGDTLVPGSHGLLVTRSGGAAFLYTPGEELKSIPIRSGYHVAQFQNGDVSSTRYILLEKDTVGSQENTLMALGSLLGVNKKEDYLLMDIDSGLPLYVNIASEGKTTSVMSNCYRKSANSIVNYCQTTTSFDSLYQPSTGLPNHSHYYWRLYWFKVPDGRRVVIAQEGGLSTIEIVNLDTGSRNKLFERMMGIAGYSARLTGEGKLDVVAKMGFTRERIADAVAVLDGAIPAPVEVGGVSLF